MSEQDEKILYKILQEEFLSPREKKIISLRFEGKSLQEVGEQMGVTRERIRQIGVRIKRKLRENLTKQEVAQYIVEYSAIHKHL